jgi:hypothetical protein
MDSIIEPNAGGHVVLRGHAIAIDSDIGHAFVTDCVRFIEGLITEEALKSKYGLTEEGWRSLAANEPLQQRVGTEKQRRIVSGDCAREKAAHLFVKAVDVVGDIVQDPTASAKHRLDGARELRTAAQGGAETNTQSGDRVIINLNFGTHKLTKDVVLKPVVRELTIEPDDDGPRPTGLPIWR